MARFNFYYDESEHSRKLTLKTLTAEEFYDGFTAVVVGWDENDEPAIEEAYLEAKYLSSSSRELKSTALPKKQFEYGFRSLSKANAGLVGDFLALLDEKVHVYLFYSSKIENLVKQLISCYRGIPYISADSLEYSLTKLLIQYRPHSVVEALYESPDKLIDELRRFLDIRVERNKANPELKRLETEQCLRIREFLDSVDPIDDIDWDYRPAFDGVGRYLGERDYINDWGLFIDREDKTTAAARECGFSNVRQIDSKDSFGVRMADMLAGILAKLFKAVRHEMAYATPADEVCKGLFDDKWFEIDDCRLVLYKQLHEVLLVNDKSWFKVYGGAYADDLVVTFSLLNFFAETSDAVTLRAGGRNLPEEFNAYCCADLEVHFKRMGTKSFPNGRDPFRPRLLVTDEPVVKHVTGVGMNEYGAPFVSVLEDDAESVYLLPESLAEWTHTLIAAGCDELLFPTDVKFQVCGGRCAADIL